MDERKLREKAVHVSLELGLNGFGSEKIYDALNSVLTEERRRAANIASMFTMKPDARIHPEIPFAQMNEASRIAAHTTAQQIAGEILEAHDAQVT